MKSKAWPHWPPPFYQLRVLRPFQNGATCCSNTYVHLWRTLPLKPGKTDSPHHPSACRSHLAASTQPPAEAGTTSNTEAPPCSYQHAVIDRVIRPSSSSPPGGHSEAFSSYLWAGMRHPLRCHRSSTSPSIQSGFSSFAQMSFDLRVSAYGSLS